MVSQRVSWPQGFVRIPNEPWTTQAVEELAQKYDTVEQHGWYDNLDPTVDALAAIEKNAPLVIDYSGGTGILLHRLFSHYPNFNGRFVIVDASPKFLRLALQKFANDERVAFRWLRYHKETSSLDALHDVLDPSLHGHVDMVVSTNAVHLYFGLDTTFASWARVLKPGGLVHVQSGNVANPELKPGEWIIDHTVEKLQACAHARVKSEPKYADFAQVLSDTTRMAAHTAYRNKVFLPVRPLSYYVDTLKKAGLMVSQVDKKVFTAQVGEWFDFLSAYHEAVLGWAGGIEKIEGQSASPAVVALRQELLRAALFDLFKPATSFPAAWTYIGATRQ